MPRNEKLTTKQIEWAHQKWCEGHTQQQIADALGVSGRTIAKHLEVRPRIRPILKYKEDYMSKRMIYADDVLELIDREKSYMTDVGRIHARAAVNAAPTVEPKKGRWLPHMEEMEDGLGKTHTIQTGLVCSECDDYSCCGGNFCKNCGADMRGEEDA